MRNQSLNNTIDTIETQEQIINCIGKLGYAVVDTANISVLDESEIRLRPIGIPFDRNQGVELLRELYL